MNPLSTIRTWLHREPTRSDQPDNTTEQTTDTDQWTAQVRGVDNAADDGTCVDELTSEEIDAILADPYVSGSEAEHAYYWEHGCLPGHEWELPDGAEPQPDLDHHHLWLSDMGDPQLNEHLAEYPDDAAAVARVRAERAERAERADRSADTDEPAF